MAEKKSALIIANSQYEDPILRQLIAPAQDAEALAQVLSDPAISGFEVHTILNAPRYKVEEEIEAFFSDSDRNDLLLLYFSGHGVTDGDGLLYYATYNTNPKRLRSTAVSANFVNDSMTNCRSRRQVLLLDCCHSGAFARTKAAPDVNAGQQFGGRTPEEGRGRFVLTASDAYQYSFEGDAVKGQAVYSVFTQALVQGLRTGEADLDGDGLITLDELYQYVHRRVTDKTPNQSPRKWAYDVDLGLAIARNPRPVEAPLPEDLQAAISNFFAEPREAAVQRLDALLRGKHRGLALSALKALLVLKDDDSRRVASAAEKCLAARAEQIQALGEPVLATAAPAPVVSQPEAGEEARLEEEERERLERESNRATARALEEERKRAEAQERLEQQRKQAAEQAWLEERRKQAAEQARLEEERRRAAEQARLEEERRQASAQARLEEERRQAAADKARLEQQERERRVAAEKARREQEEHARHTAPAKALPSPAGLTAAYAVAVGLVWAVLGICDLYVWRSMYPHFLSSPATVATAISTARWGTAGLMLALVLRRFAPELPKKYLATSAVVWAGSHGFDYLVVTTFHLSRVTNFLGFIGATVVKDAVAGGVTGLLLARVQGNKRWVGMAVGGVSFGLSAVVAFGLSNSLFNRGWYYSGRALLDFVIGTVGAGAVMWYFRRSGKRGTH